MKFLDTVDVAVYIACPMSLRDKAEMVARAKRVSDILKDYGITPISPVIEEQVKPEPGKLINADRERLRGFWTRDKEILVERAHAMLWDHAHEKSFGCEREYALNRFCLWKPTVILVPQGYGTSVAEWEDDCIVRSVEEAAKHIVLLWGTRRKRILWRVQMLTRTLPVWLYRQAMAWR